MKGVDWVFCANFEGYPKLRQEVLCKGSLMIQVLNPAFRRFWEDGRCFRGGRKGRHWYSPMGEPQRRKDVFHKGGGEGMV